MTQTDVREYPAHWSGTAVRRLSFPPNSRQIRQPGNCPTSFLETPHFPPIVQSACWTAQSSTLPLWRGFRVPHQHSPEVSRKLEVALAVNFGTPLVHKTKFRR